MKKKLRRSDPKIYARLCSVDHFSHLIRSTEFEWAACACVLCVCGAMRRHFHMSAQRMINRKYVVVCLRLCVYIRTSSQPVSQPAIPNHACGALTFALISFNIHEYTTLLLICAIRRTSLLCFVHILLLYSQGVPRAHMHRIAHTSSECSLRKWHSVHISYIIDLYLCLPVCRLPLARSTSAHTSHISEFVLFAQFNIC